MVVFDRRIWGIDRQFGLFLLIAPMASFLVFAMVFAIETWIRLDCKQGLFAFYAVIIGGSFALATHYLIATIPSVIVWASVMRTTKILGLSHHMGMRIASVLTSFVASLLIFVWIRDSDYVNLLTRLTIIAVIISYLVVEVLLFSQKAAVKP